MAEENSLRVAVFATDDSSAENVLLSIPKGLAGGHYPGSDQVLIEIEKVVSDGDYGLNSSDPVLELTEKLVRKNRFEQRRQQVEGLSQTDETEYSAEPTLGTIRFVAKTTEVPAPEKGNQQKKRRLKEKSKSKLLEEDNPLPDRSDIQFEILGGENEAGISETQLVSGLDGADLIREHDALLFMTSHCWGTKLEDCSFLVSVAKNIISALRVPRDEPPRLKSVVLLITGAEVGYLPQQAFNQTLSKDKMNRKLSRQEIVMDMRHDADYFFRFLKARLTSGQLSGTSADPALEKLLLVLNELDRVLEDIHGVQHNVYIQQCSAFGTIGEAGLINSISQIVETGSLGPRAEYRMLCTLGTDLSGEKRINKEALDFDPFATENAFVYLTHAAAGRHSKLWRDCDTPGRKMHSPLDLLNIIDALKLRSAPPNLAHGEDANGLPRPKRRLGKR